MGGAASEEEMLNIRLSVFVQKINRERKGNCPMFSKFLSRHM